MGDELMEGALAAALAPVSDAVLVTDPKGVILCVNPAFTAMSGFSAGEAIGTTPWLLLSEAQDRATDEGPWSTILAGESWRGEFVGCHRRGVPIAGDRSITPVVNEGGTVTHLVVVHAGVTVQGQPAVGQNLGGQRLEAAGSAITATDLQGRTNAPYLDAPGDLAPIVGVSAGVTDARADPSRARRTAVAELGRRDLTDLDLGLLIKDVVRIVGTDLDFGVLIEDVVRIVATELDVSMVKVLELTPDGEDLLLAAGIGWQEGLVGAAMVANDRRSQAGYTLLQDRAVIVADLASETRFEGPHLLTSHGVVAGMSTPIRGVNGDYGILAAHTTSPRSFSADEAIFLDAVAGVLGAAVARRRIEQQLRTAVDRLARSEEMRVAFLRATSHELRTPLTSIAGFAHTLQTHDVDLDDAERQSLLERLTDNAGRLHRLIDDLLDVDRLSSGLVTANLEPHDLEQLVRRVVAEHEPSDRHLELDLEAVVAEVDPPKLERVVANLVANAARHTPPAGAIRVALHRHDAETVLVVEDDGVGIDPAYLERIFEPFVQGPDQRHVPRPGTGLGLTLARELVELHHGSLTASNRPEGGARFEVHLPAP